MCVDRQRKAHRQTSHCLSRARAGTFVRARTSKMAPVARRGGGRRCAALAACQQHRGRRGAKTQQPKRTSQKRKPPSKVKRQSVSQQSVREAAVQKPVRQKNKCRLIDRSVIRSTALDAAASAAFTCAVHVPLRVRRARGGAGADAARTLLLRRRGRESGLLPARPARRAPRPASHTRRTTRRDARTRVPLARPLPSAHPLRERAARDVAADCAARATPLPGAPRASPRTPCNALRSAPYTGQRAKGTISVPIAINPRFPLARHT